MPFLPNQKWFYPQRTSLLFGILDQVKTSRKNLPFLYQIRVPRLIHGSLRVNWGEKNGSFYKPLGPCYMKNSVTNGLLAQDWLLDLRNSSTSYDDKLKLQKRAIGITDNYMLALFMKPWLTYVFGFNISELNLTRQQETCL